MWWEDIDRNHKENQCTILVLLCWGTHCRGPIRNSIRDISWKWTLVDLKDLNRAVQSSVTYRLSAFFAFLTMNGRGFPGMRMVMAVVTSLVTVKAGKDYPSLPARPLSGFPVSRSLHDLLIWFCCRLRTRKLSLCLLRCRHELGVRFTSGRSSLLCNRYFIDRYRYWQSFTTSLDSWIVHMQYAFTAVLSYNYQVLLCSALFCAFHHTWGLSRAVFIPQRTSYFQLSCLFLHFRQKHCHG